MGKEFMKSVCMVCMLCTIHTHCSVHHTVGNLSRTIDSHNDESHNFSRPSWSEASEPTNPRALNPLLDLKHFKNSQSKEHYKHYGETSDAIEFERRTSDPTPTKVSDKTVDSVHPSENVDVERINSNKNENNSEKFVKLIPNSIDEGVRLNSLETLRSSFVDSKTHTHRVSRDTKAVNTTSEQFHLHQVFAKFGDGEKMTYEGFERLLKTIGLERLVAEELSKVRSTVENPVIATNTQSSNNSTSNVNNFNATQINQKSVSRCLKSRDVFSAFVNPSKDEHLHEHGREHDHEHDVHDHGDGAGEMKTLNKDALYNICPTLLYQLSSATDKEIEEGCFLTRSLLADTRNEEKEEINMAQVWLYSTLSIFGISLCGLLGVAVIPIMQNTFYHQLLQFLVSLAIGTLCGDALMHLLPHAMGPVGHSHNPSHMDSLGHDHFQDEHNSSMWKGLIAALGLLFFFVTERCLLLGGEWLKQRQRKRKVPARVRVMRDAENNTANATVGEKLCKHKYSSYPYCYGEITTDISDDHHHKNPQYNKTEHNHNMSPPADDKTDPPGNGTYSQHAAVEDDHEPQMSFLGHDGTGKAEKTEAMELNPSEAESYTVIIREHENAHHGHSHTHGHVHSAPSNLSSVACMVIMGDGLHNLTDGMAIGAAFAASIAGGFSTAIAVFCHELPHEIGDFAVLLKAGMSPKQAIFYNVLSSILCLVGMIIGVHIGQHESSIQWIFALAGGLFLYIALVDMIPELTSSHSNEGGSFIQFLLQISGMLCGLGIMLVIAVNEHKLKTIFSN